MHRNLIMIPIIMQTKKKKPLHDEIKVIIQDKAHRKD